MAFSMYNLTHDNEECAPKKIWCITIGVSLGILVILIIVFVTIRNVAPELLEGKPDSTDNPN